jgi:hypothetical protein
MNQYRYRNCEYVQRQHTTLAITSGYSRCFECEKGISMGKEYYYRAWSNLHFDRVFAVEPPVNVADSGA